MAMHAPVVPASRALLGGLLALALSAAGCGGGGGSSTPPPPTSGEGTLILTSTPANAQILLDGTDTGQRTPVEITREVQAAGTTFAILLRLPGYEDATATATVKPGEAIPVDLTLIQSRPPEVPPHTITGRVYLQQSAGGTAPATDATVTATEATSGEAFAATLDTSSQRVGTYYIFAPAGTYHVTATAPGYQPQTRDVTILSGEDRKTGIDFTLSP